MTLAPLQLFFGEKISDRRQKYSKRVQQQLIRILRKEIAFPIKRRIEILDIQVKGIVVTRLIGFFITKYNPSLNLRAGSFNPIRDQISSLRARFFTTFNNYRVRLRAKFFIIFDDYRYSIEARFFISFNNFRLRLGARFFITIYSPRSYIGLNNRVILPYIRLYTSFRFIYATIVVVFIKVSGVLAILRYCLISFKLK